MLSLRKYDYCFRLQKLQINIKKNRKKILIKKKVGRAWIYVSLNGPNTWLKSVVPCRNEGLIGLVFFSVYYT